MGDKHAICYQLGSLLGGVAKQGQGSCSFWEDTCTQQKGGGGAKGGAFNMWQRNMQCPLPVLNGF